jgi:anti-sigma B factor antagonist
MMEIRTSRKFKEYRVMELSGRIDSSASGGLEEVLEDLIQSEKNLIVDLSGVYFISSQGMRVLLNTKKQIASGNGKMILTGLSGNVREVLSMLGLSILRSWAGRTSWDITQLWQYDRCWAISTSLL